MLYITRVNRCPSCGHHMSSRRKRRAWMRLLPNSSYRKCDRCSTKYVCLSCGSSRPATDIPDH